MSKGTNDKTKLKTVKVVLNIGLNVDWDTKGNRQLLAAILALETPEEAKRFLRDLLTPEEIDEFANRLEAARLLSKHVQYNAITESTGQSSATIARIAKWLYGSLGGYRLILKRLANHSDPSPQRKGLSLSDSQLDFSL
jgi:TrpR-related protein YerC/YecD